MYITLSNEDSITNFSGEIKVFDFTVELGKNVNLATNYECALVDVKFKVVEGVRRPALLVFCDIVEANFVHGKFLPFLRRVDRTENFTNPYYKSVSRQQFNKLRVYILDKNLQPPSVTLDSFTCTLHFREQ